MAFKVLIVDDEAHARTNLRLALEPLGDWVVAAECAGAAAARTFLQTNEVDLVLLDVQMPQESGIEMARSLGATSPRFAAASRCRSASAIGRPSSPRWKDARQ